MNKKMKCTVRALTFGALIFSLAACVVTPPPHASAAAPRANAPTAFDRYRQVNDRIDYLGRRIDSRVNEGYYPPPQGSALHHRLDLIGREAQEMASQHRGGLSGDEARVLNQELDAAARAIGA